MKRVFTLALGLGVGIVLGAAIVRRLDRAQQAVAPSHLAAQAGRAAGTFTGRFQAAVEEGRQAAEVREAELRASYEVPGMRRALGQ